MTEGGRSVRDEITSLKIDRNTAPPRRRRTPRFVWGLAIGLAAMGAAAAYRLTLGAPTVVRVAFAERLDAAAGAPSAAGSVLTGSGYVVTG